MRLHKFSESQRVERDHTARWDALYSVLFPGCQIERMLDDMDYQRAGVDVVILHDGRAILVDEKVRRRDYGDFLIETWSVYYGAQDPRNRVGWTLDPDKRTDLIAYGIVESSRCWLIDYPALRAVVSQRAWNGRAVVAQNAGYQTINHPVSWRDLHGWLGRAISSHAWPYGAIPRHSVDTGLRVVRPVNGDGQ